MTEEVGFIGKIFGRKTEQEAKKKTIKLGNQDNPLFASEFKRGKKTWAWLVKRDISEKYMGKNVAIALQINRPIVQLVSEYLENRKIKAHLILMTTHEELELTKELDDYNEDEWRAIVQDFRDLITRIQTRIGNAKFHFFFAAPAALTTALGIVFGNFWNARIYNWVKGKNTYRPILKLPIRL